MSKRFAHHGVIVGTDGSPWSQEAVKWAAQEAAMRMSRSPSFTSSPPYRSRRQRWRGPPAEFPQEVLEIQENDGRGSSPMPSRSSRTSRRR